MVTAEVLTSFVPLLLLYNTEQFYLSTIWHSALNLACKVTCTGMLPSYLHLFCFGDQQGKKFVASAWVSGETEEILTCTIKTSFQ